MGTVRVAALVRRLLCACGLALLTTFVTATPAWAHGSGGTRATNYKIDIRSVDPALPGVEVRVVDLDRFELRNRSDRTVVVEGYEEEPYLRIGPDGAFENRRSPAVFLNRSASITRKPPASTDPDAIPEWRKVSEDSVARWHDHRAHWMGDEDPPAVQRDPGNPQVVQEFEITIRDGARRSTVRGDLLWVPGPSPLPWVLAAVGLAAALVALSTTRSWIPWLAVSLAITLAAAVLHIIGSWGAGTQGAAATLGGNAYSIVGIGLGVVALTWLWRRGGAAAVPLVLFSGIILALVGGLAEVTVVGQSQILTTLPLDFARATIVITLGFGTGLVIASCLHLRVPIAPQMPRDPPERTEPLLAARYSQSG